METNKRGRSFSNSASPSPPSRRKRFSDSEDDDPRKKKGVTRSRPSKSASPGPRDPRRAAKRARRHSPSSSRSSSRSKSHSSSGSDSSRSRSRSRGRVRRHKRRKDRRRHRSRSSSRSSSSSRSPSRTRRRHHRRRRRRDRSRSGSSSDSSSDDEQKGPQLTFKQFLLQQKDDVSPEQAQKMYAQYVKEHKMNKSRRFFERHKAEEWFQERYDPVVIAARRTAQKVTAAATAEKLLKKLRENALNLEDDLPEAKVNGEAGADKENDNGEAGSPKSGDKSDEDSEKVNGVLKTDDKSSPKFKPVTMNGDLKFEDNSLFIQAVPLEVRRAQLEEVLGSVPGFLKVLISDPVPKNRGQRYAWASYSGQDECEKALREINGRKLVFNEDGGHFFLHTMPKRRATRKIKYAGAYTLNPERVKSDLERARRIITKLDLEKGIKDAFEGGFIDALEPGLRRLNFMLMYLREVHIFCYYCGKDYFEEEQLQSKCGKKHARASRSESDSTDIPPWASSLDTTIDLRISSPPADPCTWTHRTTQKLKESNTKFIEKGRYRCGLCAKLFRGSEFIHKHISNKHAKMTEDHLKKVRQTDYLKAFEADPDRSTLEVLDAVLGAGHVAGGAVPVAGGPMGRPVVGGPRMPPPFRPMGMGHVPMAPSIVIPASGKAPYLASRAAPQPFIPHAPFVNQIHRPGGRPDNPDSRRVRSYEDFDRAPPAEEEEEIDYGLGGPKPKLHF
eukprot:90551_1